MSTLLGMEEPGTSRVRQARSFWNLLSFWETLFQGNNKAELSVGDIAVIFITFAPFFSIWQKAFSLKLGKTMEQQHGPGHCKLKYLAGPRREYK